MFVGFYAKWLFFPAILGIFVQASQFVSGMADNWVSLALQVSWCGSFKRTKTSALLRLSVRLAGGAHLLRGNGRVVVVVFGDVETTAGDMRTGVGHA